jgi:hypothetical protein
MPKDQFQQAGAVWQRVLSESRRARKRFMNSGDEIARYAYSPDYQFEYQTLPAQAFFRAKASLMGEAVRVLGPYLYQQNPHRTVAAKPWSDQFMAQRADIMGKLLNYSVRETGHYAQSRRRLEQALLYGRGVLWTERHPSKPLYRNGCLNVRDFYTDPNGMGPEEWRWIARRRVMSKVRGRLEYPQYAQEIDRLPQAPRRAKGDDSSYRWASQDEDTLGKDAVAIWEIYHLDGLDGQAGPVCYLADDQARIFGAMPWPVPFYLDQRWPATLLDFYDCQESPWPISPLEGGIGYQRAINWLVTLLMGKFRYTSRTALAIATKNGQGIGDSEAAKLLVGGDIEAIKVALNGENTKISDYVQLLTHDNAWLAPTMNLLTALEQRFQKATGVYEILYAGDTAAQIRSATDASIKDRNSRSRVEDMRDRVIMAEGQAARNEALASRFGLKREDIQQSLGPEAARGWGFLVRPEQKDVMWWIQSLAQQGVPLDEAVGMAQEQVQQAVDIRQWIMETDYDIEADSIRRRDIDQRIDSLKELMNQTVPLQLQAVDPAEKALGYETIAAYHEAIGTPIELVRQYRTMAEQLRTMPPPAPAPPEPARADV